MFMEARLIPLFFSFSLFLMVAICGKPLSGQEPSTDIALQLVQLLDVDGDKELNPYEGAEALLRLLRSADANNDGGIDTAELQVALSKADAERQSEATEMFALIDKNNDKFVTLETEVPAEYQALALAADVNKDGKLTLAEFSTIQDSPEDSAADEAAALLELIDPNGDGKVTRKELPSPLGDKLFKRADTNSDKVITRAELEEAIRRESQPAAFTVKGNRCVMIGIIGPSTPGRVLELVCEHPEVKVIEMRDVPGSMHDPSNLIASRMIRQHGLATHLPADGVIASGGVDFFLAGARRSVDKGGRLGVHSWGGAGMAGHDLARDHASHLPYLEFYKEIGTPAEFYWYTLNAAGPEDVHWMTPEEMTRFHVVSPSVTRKESGR